MPSLAQDRPSKLRTSFAELREKALDLFFPRRCVNCNRVGSLLCTQCQSKINRVVPPICEYCGRGGIDPTARRCSSCEERPLSIESIRAVGYHEGPLREAVHALKYNHLSGLAFPLGALVAQWMRENSWTADAAIPVPLYPDRERERGYNQAVLIARAASMESGIVLLESGLVRVRPTRDQVGLDRASRRRNMEGAFQANDMTIRGKTIVVIDDVTTTGATLESCAIALYNSGAKRVRGLTVSRPRWDT